MSIYTQKPDILDLSKAQLIDWLKDHEIRSFRAEQIFKWLYLHNVDTFSGMSNLSKDLRTQLSDRFRLDRLTLQTVAASTDGSKKYLFRLLDGEHIETVLIPEKSHHTICISTQVGCAQGCRFCHTAAGGFSRNLRTGEIIAQIRDVKKDMADPARLKNIVMMGMGEPLANLDNVIRALSTITDGDCGLKFSTRRVTVSTVGLASKLQALGRKTTANLAISLNATDNKTRSMLMPVNRKYPIEDLMAACARYPLAPRRKITFEYILIKDINDSMADAARLSQLLKPLSAKVNLIPFNPHAGCAFQRPSEETIHHFLQLLHDKGHTAIIRYSKGTDIAAACGQLRAMKGKKAGPPRDGSAGSCSRQVVT